MTFWYIVWTADSFAIKFGLIAHYHEPECFYEKLDCYVQGEGHSKISKCLWMFCPDGIFLHAELFTTILGVVMHHYEPDCLSKRLVCCLQGEGHSYG